MGGFFHITLAQGAHLARFHPIMTQKAAISVANLSKTYPGGANTPDKVALDHVDLTIKKGSIFGLLGPNGAGKSTLINILAGLTVKSSGDVTIGGINQDADPRGTRFKIGVVPQEVVIDPFFQVRAHLEIFAGYYGIRPEERRTDELLKALSLTDKANTKPRKLSGGMRRRLLIAKALVHSPEILVLDEPTAGVDVELRTQLWEYVRELNKKGTTILLTTHYLEEAEELCDEIAIINHGRIIAHDKTAKIIGSLDQKTLVVKGCKKVKAPKSLAKFSPEQRDDYTIALTYKPSECSMEALLQAVKKAGIELADISTEEPDLEDAFREMVKEKAA